MRRKIETLSISNFNAEVQESPGMRTADMDTWQLVAMHEILVELRRLNSLLHCHNFVAIPRKLDAIQANTTKPKRKRKAAT